MIVNGKEVSAEEFLKGLQAQKEMDQRARESIVTGDVLRVSVVSGPNHEDVRFPDTSVQSMSYVPRSPEEIAADEREAMQPTMRLRWRKVPMTTDPTWGHVTQFEQHILQQEYRGWRSSEWRDVPTEEET